MKIKLSTFPFECLVAMTLAITGCNSTTPPEKVGVNGLLDPVEWSQSLATNNAYALSQYTNEWQYNRSGPTTEPPHIGLALSGGGQRSATFCIGILQGLQDIGVLSKIDVMSSVSGGGYAASWLYIQSMENGFNSDELFTNTGKYQQYLFNHGELLSHFAATTNGVETLFRRTSYSAEIIATAISVPFNIVENGIFSWHANVVPLRRYYEHGIDRDYDVVPNNEGKRSSLDITGLRDFSMLNNLPSHVKFENFACSNIQGRLPFPIINTTAHIDAAPSQDAGLLQNRVFEFTPLHYGNDYFGYQTTNYPFDYNRAISVSGAAADAKEFSEPNESLLISIANFDLGYSINNPNVSSSGRFYRKLLPIPFYLFDKHYQRDFYGDRIYLADGGHSENLGAYSLVRRFCRTIIIVDAEHDPTNSFESYHLLKKALRREMGVDFSVTNIDQGLFTTNNLTTPVMTGTISCFPLENSSGVISNLTIKVIYVKLSFDAEQLTNGYDNAIKSYYWKTRNKMISLHTEKSEFPQESTDDLSYNPEQVLADHDLGRFIITNNSSIFENATNFH